jgi:predicted Zn-dependent protease
LIAAIAALSLVAPPEALAQQKQQRLWFVRDSETENTIRDYAAPLFRAAGLDPSAIRVHLINDRQLNAFVAQGQNMFIFTGLLMRAEHAGQVIGVIAHETGHIAGGHLSRTNEEIANAWYQFAIAAGLGLAAAVASGSGGAALAGAALGAQLAERNFLAYSRAQESAADQAALSYLERTGQSARGLQEFLEILADQELVAVGRQDPYVRTHPINAARVQQVRLHADASRYSRVPIKPELAEMHRRMRAKLTAFLEPARALQVYKESDNSIDSRYARAIAWYKRPDLSKALPLMDSLIAERPNDPYFQEMKGQMLFENGRVADSIPHYERAVGQLPNDPLLRSELAHAQLELNRPELVNPALENQLQALRVDNVNGETWRYLAIAYGRDGQLGMAALAQAERALIQGKGFDARQFAERASRQLPQGSAAWLRAQDIKEAPRGPGDRKRPN